MPRFVSKSLKKNHTFPKFLGIIKVCRNNYMYEVLDSFKPGIPFMGHRQIAPDVTPQNEAASHLGLFCVLRKFSSKN